MKKSHFFALLGAVLGIGAPLGLMAYRLLDSPLPLHTCLEHEWDRYHFFYLYMLVGTSLVFAVFGFLTGRNEDLLIQKDIDLKKEVLTDPLTGLGNHRFLHDTFKVEFRRHKSTRQPISCLMMDLDHFKRINDEHGHPFGDHVLKHFAGLVRKSIREHDVAARYGGEEFLCILPDCDREQARMVAERIRRSTERFPFMKRGKRVRVTVSLGSVTSYESSGLNYRQLIALADRALYDAKHRGRNQLIQTTLTMDKRRTLWRG